MQDVFITKIHIDKVRHLQGVDICLSDSVRRNLILTGKNGSGKTSLLEAMRDSVLYEQQFTGAAEKRIIPLGGIKKPDIDIHYSQKINNFSSFVFAYISARRSEPALPKSIEAIEIKDKSRINQNASKQFLKYILNLDYRLYGAKSDANIELETRLEKWFADFLRALREIYDCQELTLKRDAKNLAFQVQIPGREPFALHEMSDGYAAVLEIIMELLMRFESADAVVQYEQSAIVLIDEIEAHLHVELQKRVLPFLTQMFSNVQFVVSTHSPFIINSLGNAVVYDLEKREILENPSVYSYEAVVEGYLNVGQYADEMRNKFSRYKELFAKELNDAERNEFQRLVSELQMVPPASKELYYAFRTMEDRRRR